MKSVNETYVIVTNTQRLFFMYKEKKEARLATVVCDRNFVHDFIQHSLST